MKSELEQQTWDIVLSDYMLPDFGGLPALELLKISGKDIPFIVVSGQIGEDVAVEAMREGASDYIMKGNLKRLGAAIARELEESENRKQRRKAEKDLAISEAELRMLSHRLIMLQEDERRNLARELHDEIGHTLAYLRLIIDRSSKSPRKVTQSALDEAKQILTNLIEQVRNLSLSLKPPMLEEDGLLQAIKYLIERYSKESAISITLNSSDVPQSIPWDFSLAAYRIVQESITNIIKHSKAIKVSVNINIEKNNMYIKITDNGVGFTTEKLNTGSGLRGMRERAKILGGKLNVESVPGTGTTISAVLPISI